MKVFNLNKETLKASWMVSGLSPRIPPHIEGLTASFFIKATFQLHPDKDPTPWPKGPERCSGDKMIDGDKNKGLGYISDFAPYKPYADFAAIGTGYPPSEATGHFIVRMQVGDHAREIGVIGERQWQHSFAAEGPGKPSQVKATQLSWNNAWGGKDYPMNPLGIGREGLMMHTLVDPLHLVRSTSEVVPPAVFAPYPKTCPQRRAKLGTYGGDYATTGWPWFAQDFDYSYYNATDERQWIKGYLRGDEDLFFKNMHPKHPEYRTCLPKIRARCFLTQTVNWCVELKPEEAKREFRELQMDLDTLWVDMNQEKLILVWRGRAPTRSLKLRDFGNILILTEPLGQKSEPLAHYQTLLAEASRIKKPEIPSGPSPDPLRINAKIQAASAIALKRRAANRKLSAANVTGVFEKTDPQEAQHLAAELKNVPSPDAAFIAAMPKSHEQAVNLLKTAQGKSEVLSKLDAAAFLTAPQLPDIEGERGEILRKMEEQKAIIKSKLPAMRKRADFMKGQEIDLEKIRKDGLEKVDMRGADFSGLDLRGVNFRRSVLSKANFSKCNLSGADFTGANMRGADLSGADLSGAILDRADLCMAILSGVIWNGVSLTNANLSKSALAGSDFTNAKGNRADFSHSDLTGASFVGADLPGASFHKALLEKADFSKAKLIYADFRGSKSAGIRMDDADLTKFRAGIKADFTGGSFLRVIAPKSVWASSNLDKANFLQSTMTRSRLTEAIIRDANFDRCDLTEANFEDSILHRTALSNANLLRARFSRADLTHANLDGSNMYQAGFWKTVLLHASWHNANIKKTMLDR